MTFITEAESGKRETFPILVSAHDSADFPHWAGVLEFFSYRQRIDGRPAFPADVGIGDVGLPNRLRQQTWINLER